MAASLYVRGRRDETRPRRTGPDEAGQREADADERERIADARDYLADAREEGNANREIEVDAILAAAEARDDQATLRDTEADKRDMAANLDAFLSDVDDAQEYHARSLAKRDRMSSRGDRIASGTDRAKLADGRRAGDHRDETQGSRQAADAKRAQASTDRERGGERAATPEQPG